ncbi:ACT domain-containing protein [Sphingomonas humi]|uniref:Acetolactate synthase n=1 Tax=Sphingomonas humi TaxID=335630 RepID=A0ABP7RCA0_9SPHN
MTARLNVDFVPTEGAMLRILGLIERRGFRVRELNLGERQSSSSLSILIEARDAGRQVEVVARQIAGLSDVSAVEVTPSQTMVPA